MSEFSNLLNQYIHQKGGSIRALAHRLGMPAATLTKLCNGTRSPRNQRANIEHICSLLMLSPSQITTLWNAFECELVGADVYAARISVKKLIESMAVSDSTERQVPVSHELPPIDLLDKQKDVYAILRSFLNNAAAQGGRQIDIIWAPGDPVVAEMLRVALRAYDIRVRHILPLTSSDKSTGQIDSANIDSIRCVMPMLLDSGASGSVYLPYYCYTGRGSGLMEFNHVFISDSGVLLCMQDYSHAMFFANKEVQQYWHRLFTERLASCRALSVTEIGMEKQILHYAHLLDEAGDSDEMLSVSWQPCLLFYASPEMLARCLPPELLQRSGQFEFFVSYLKRLYTRKKRRAYFTQDGLLDFVKTGILRELPAELQKVAVPREVRRALLQKMLEDARAGGLMPHFARNDRFRIGRDAVVYYYGADTIAIGALNQHLGNAVCFIQELSTNWSALNLLESFDDIDWFLSEEETCTILQNIIETSFPARAVPVAMSPSSSATPVWVSAAGQ